MQHIATALPGLTAPCAYTPWPVWRDSTRREVKYQPLSKRQAVRLWHKVRRFERQTRQPGRQDGAIGRNGLAVVHAFLHDFVNHLTGRLDPSHATIARAAAISERSVRRGLAKLKAAGVINWLRRCVEDHDEQGRYRLRQRSNAYAVLPVSQWRGFHEPPDPPPPHPTAWGAVPPLPDVMAQATADRAAGGSYEAQLRLLEDDPGNKLAAVLARFGRLIPE
jgi:hypothetical protein